jgi:hypothetical protein
MLPPSWICRLPPLDVQRGDFIRIDHSCLLGYPALADTVEKSKKCKNPEIRAKCVVISKRGSLAL